MQSQVKELLVPAVTVTVVPLIAHLAEMAVAGGVEAASSETKEAMTVVNEAAAVNVQVVPEDIAHDPTSAITTGWLFPLL